jgi:peptidoglycan-associated lipoprotein
MTKYTLIKHIVLGTVMVTVAACSSTRHKTPAVTDANAMGGAQGAYAEGLGSSGGFQPATGCNIPQTAGYSTQPYYFDYDRSDVHPDDMNRLGALAQSVAGAGSTIKVVGNTDNRGSRDYNLALGWRRANAVSSSLEQYGVNKQQIMTESNGAEKPVAFGSSDEDYQCNRRVDAIYAEQK